MKNKHRTIFLGITAMATAFTLGKSFLYSEIKRPIVKNYTFPESITLSQWELSTSKPVNPSLVKSPANISGYFIAEKYYLYHQSQTPLKIEMRYLTNTNGDLKSFITSQTGELSSVLKQDSRSGFYSLYTHEDKLYLNACINPHGSSTVTSDQFNRNLMIHNTRPEKILPWLLGIAEFRDKRCLWAHLSIPLESNITVEETYQTLETVWFDWYSWWKSHYPDPV